MHGNPLMVAALVALVLAASANVFAHGEKARTGNAAVKKEQKPWGIAGDPKRATRSIEVRMLDTMRFTPERIEVRQGETVRFVYRNEGKVMHEFVLGTRKELERACST